MVKMRFLLVLATLALGLAAPPAGWAQGAAPQAQQQRMASCNAEAKNRNLGGDARKNFMSDCLAGRSQPGNASSPAQAAQQQKMRNCNAQATQQKLAGDARQKFMSTCLKG
jgi:hypothetical protein